MTTWKDTVRAATTAELAGFVAGPPDTFTNLAPSPIDGLTLVIGDRVLVKNQTDQEQNGIYEVTDTAPDVVLERNPDAVEPEAVVRVAEGEINAHTEWSLATFELLDDPTRTKHFVKRDLVFNV